MVQPFTGYLAKDNKPFPKEIDAVRHDAILDITKSFPELKGATQDNSRFTSLCDLLEPYILLRNHLAMPVADTTRETGPSGDTHSLAIQRGDVSNFQPSAKPKWDACGGIPFEQGNAPLPEGCICSPFDYAALGHMTHCPCFVREPKFDACPGTTHVISSEDAAQWRGCPDPWHQQPGTDPDTCPTCGMKV